MAGGTTADTDIAAITRHITVATMARDSRTTTVTVIRTTVTMATGVATMAISITGTTAITITATTDITTAACTSRLASNDANEVAYRI